MTGILPLLLGSRLPPPSGKQRRLVVKDLRRTAEKGTGKKTARKLARLVPLVWIFVSTQLQLASKVSYGTGSSCVHWITQLQLMVTPVQ